MILTHPDIPITSLEADVSYFVFAGANAYQNTNLILGNAFLGLTENMGFVFRDHDLPKGAEMITSVVELVPSVGRATACQAVIRLFLRDSVWNVEPFRPAGWRIQSFFNFRAQIRDTGAVLIEDTTGGSLSNLAWAMKFPLGTQVLERNFRLATKFTVPAGPTPTLGSIDMELQRIGAPTGNIVLEIMGVSGSAGPDEVVAATSDTIVAATIPLGPSFVSFAFSGGNQIPLPPGDYFVTMSVDHLQSAIDFINWRGRSQFFTLSRGWHYGEGAFLDYGNYPGEVDLTIRVINAAQNLPSVLWAIPATVAGVPVQTPDISAVLQQALQQPGYNTGDPIGLGFDAATSVGRRDFQAFGGAFAPAKITNITYRKRRVSVV